IAFHQARRTQRRGRALGHPSNVLLFSRQDAPKYGRKHAGQRFLAGLDTCYGYGADMCRNFPSPLQSGIVMR
ncbi:hypothetical protein HAX54_038128, partial [Datura stramonium]|nr:hypothetical protein [Datura stramonium]